MGLIGKHLIRSLLALAALMALGILGYMRIEGWSLLDAAYMTILTFTTVGYDEVRPLSSRWPRLQYVHDGGRRWHYAVHPDQRGAGSRGRGDTADPVSEA